LGCCKCQRAKEKDGVSAFGDASTSLHQAMKFFAHCLEPQISELGTLINFLSWVMVSLVIGCTNLLQAFFGVNDRACILIMDKFARD
jgi:hypothetical protein